MVRPSKPGAASPLPTSRLGRFARLAALGTRAGASRLASALGGGDEAALAEAAAGALGTMRGLALKVGQMASYVDGFVPEAHRDLYERSMRSLRDTAPTMSAEAATRVVAAELGAPPEGVFASWEPEPFASASIGQVHRATLHDGREVAVKVQYEGIARAVEADLSNVSIFSALTGPLGTKFAMKEQVAEMRARFTEELDYRHEADRQRRFAGNFAPEAPAGRDAHAARHRLSPSLFGRVRVPQVVGELSTQRVLTTELARGLGFEAACQASVAERTAWAETLWAFVFGSLLGHGLFNADPHPGNYLFAPGGTVWFLDFGCTRLVNDDRIDLLREAHRAACHGEDEAFLEASLRMLDVNAGGLYARLARRYLLDCFAPVRQRGAYHVTRDYAKGLFDGMKELVAAMLRAPRAEFVPLPAEWLFFNRLQMGFYSVLARLDVPVDYNAIERALTAAWPAEPAGAEVAAP